MCLKDVLGQIQADGANLRHGRLPLVALNTTILADRCRRGASTPSLENHDLRCGPARERPRRALRPRRRSTARRWRPISRASSSRNCRQATSWDVEKAIAFAAGQPFAWVIDVDGFIGHVRFHSLDAHDRRAALAIGIEDPPVSVAASARRLSAWRWISRSGRGCIGRRYGCSPRKRGPGRATASVVLSRRVANASGPSSRTRGRTTLSRGCLTGTSWPGYRPGIAEGQYR